MKQISFASATYDNKKVMTKRERFLTEMDTIIPWPRLLKLIEPCYPKKGKGRPPMPMESMLRIYFLQQWYSLSDPAAEEALYDIESMRRFAQLELVVDALPDETTILNFRRMVEKHRLSEVLFNDINAYLVERGIAVSQGSMVDATIISASGSTRNKDKARDPDMHSTRKIKKNMSSTQKKQNRKNSGVRARVEHCFRVVKCQFGYKKVRYKGLEKNRVQVFSLLGLANLYMLRGQLAG
jgi:IS5 family transposase